MNPGEVQTLPLHFMMSLVFAQLTHMAPRYVRESAWETAVEIGGIR
jgi:hypothetical protein